MFFSPIGHFLPIKRCRLKARHNYPAINAVFLSNNKQVNLSFNYFTSQQWTQTSGGFKCLYEDLDVALCKTAK